MSLVWSSAPPGSRSRSWGGVLLVGVVHQLTGLRPDLSLADGGNGTALAALIVGLGAYAAARSATARIVRTSRRRAEDVRLAVAAVGAIALGLTLLFVVTLALNWLAVVAVWIVPAGWVAGALRTRDERAWARPQRTWTGVAAAVLVLAGLALLLGGVAGAEGGTESRLQGLEESDAAMGFDRIGARFPAVGVAWPITDVDTSYQGSAPVGLRYAIDPAAGLTGWSDMRLEAWRGLHWAGSFPGPIDPTARRPFATLPVKIARDTIAVDLRALPRYRNVSDAWLALTALDSAARRTILAGPMPDRLVFSGTVWDWLAASDAPDR